MVGYVRVSTAEQGRSGLSLAAQRHAIERAASEREWNLVALEQDVASGTTLRRRPGLERALEHCHSGEADGIVCAKLDRLSRSLVDFAGLLEEAQREGFGLVVLDHGFDLDTASGRAMAGMLAVFAQWERDVISERTCQALAAARARGVRLGRPPLLPDHVLEQVAQLRRCGLPLRTIADRMNAAGVPAPAGGAWNHSTVRRVALRAEHSQRASKSRAIRKASAAGQGEDCRVSGVSRPTM
jgi:DNA invertase Pin-like site-specific DNA recombinase